MRYAALLRGINVGGNKKVPMADLRAMLAGLGYQDVVTHLQSGNAVFSSELPPADLEREIAAAVQDRINVSCSVLVRTGAELADAASRNPLGGEPANPSRYFVAFLSGEPDKDKAAAVTAMSFDPDKLWILGREAYLWCPQGAADARLSGAVLEKHLGVRATARNWNTVTKLVALTTG
jgi:uncharacterized protein (DUF1697 family)